MAGDREKAGEHPAGANQAAAIPVRRDKDGVRVCLIRRVDSAKWGVPEGFIEDHDDWKQAAAREAHEEAGRDGRVVGDCIGTYEYEKGGQTLVVAVGVMEVADEHDKWPEMSWRERRWCSLDEAGTLLRNHPVRSLFDRIKPAL